MRKAYEEYKATGIQWLPKIPRHWEIIRGKNLYLKLQRPVRKNDEVVTCFRDGTVTLRKNRRTTGFTEAINETGYQGIRKGDLIIHVMDAFAGSIGVSDSDGKGTPVYSVCQAKINLNNEYYAFLLREMARSGFIQSLYRGIRERSSDFRFEVFSNQYYSVPPREEQDQIVRFLDWKVSSINKLINIKQQEITELKELKKATISDAVTHGLDKTVPMKDSGIAWIGKIPQHWEISRIKSLLQYPLQYGANESGIPFNDSLPRYIRITDIDDNSNLKCTGKQSLPEKVANPFILKDGDILFARSGATAGKAFLYKKCYGMAAFAGYLIRAQLNTKVVMPKFILLVSKNCYYDQWKDMIFIQSTIPNISAERYKNFQIALPPRNEQEQIVRFLDARCAEIDRLIAAKQAQITDLHDLKSSLIVDVVTGQIDVRDVEIPDYEQVEETLYRSDNNATLHSEDEIPEEV